MGLLDQILGNVLGRSGPGRGGLGGGLGGGGMSSVLMSLLPVVLSMLANRGGGSSRSLTSGLGGHAGTGSLGGMGGLGGLIEQLTQKGYGEQAQSWVGTGSNQSLPPQAIDDVFGNDLESIASQAGISRDEARQGLTQLLPEVVDHFTPQGQLPPLDQLVASMDNYGQQLRSP